MGEGMVPYCNECGRYHAKVCGVAISNEREFALMTALTAVREENAKQAEELAILHIVVREMGDYMDRTMPPTYVDAIHTPYAALYRLDAEKEYARSVDHAKEGKGE